MKMVVINGDYTFKKRVNLCLNPSGEKMDTSWLRENMTECKYMTDDNEWWMPILERTDKTHLITGVRFIEHSKHKRH